MPASVINGHESSCRIAVFINYDYNSKKVDARSENKGLYQVIAVLRQQIRHVNQLVALLHQATK